MAALKYIADRMDKIVKSKWVLLEEIETCLPDVTIVVSELVLKGLRNKLILSLDIFLLILPAVIQAVSYTHLDVYKRQG